MTAQAHPHLASFGRSIGYRVRWFGLSIWGPAQLGDREDPMERLRRRYGRAPKAPSIAHPMGLQRSYDDLPE